MSQQSQTVQTERSVIKLNGGSRLTDFYSIGKVLYTAEPAELADVEIKGGMKRHVYPTSLEATVLCIHSLIWVLSVPSGYLHSEYVNYLLHKHEPLLQIASTRFLGHYGS